MTTREAPVTEDYTKRRCIHRDCRHIVFRDQEMTPGSRCRSCDCDDHRIGQAAPASGEHDPQTPPGAEHALQTYSQQLEDARRALAEARNAELDAKGARDKAKRFWLLSDEAPPVGVFGGVRTTVAMREAWVEDQIADEEQAFRIAEAARRAAKDLLDTLTTQGSLQQSLTKSVGDSYRSTGREPW